MLTDIELLQKRLNQIEIELEKVRGCSPITHGWQTQKLAKVSRSWDVLAMEKMKIIEMINNLKQT